jgi:conjugal transfer pilin signal peptidase TrbI
MKRFKISNIKKRLSYESLILFVNKNLSIRNRRIYEPVILFIICGIAFALFSARYYLTFEVQKGYSCLYAKALLVDTWDKDIERNDLFAFKFPVEGDAIFPKHTNFLKIARGVPGDVIDVTPNTTTTMSHRITLDMRPVATKLERDLSVISREVTLGEGEFFAMGETVYSYDSRFWGAVPKDNIIGKAYVIF